MGQLQEVMLIAENVERRRIFLYNQWVDYDVDYVASGLITPDDKGRRWALTCIDVEEEGTRLTLFRVWDGL